MGAFGTSAGRCLFVGHVLLSYIGLEGSGRDVLTLAPLSVDPDYEGRGIGTQLMEAVLAEADRSGEPLVVVLGDPAYYSRFGFEPADRFLVAPPDVLTPPLPREPRRPVTTLPSCLGH